jgi:hypothetical protein
VNINTFQGVYNEHTHTQDLSVLVYRVRCVDRGRLQQHAAKACRGYDTARAYASRIKLTFFERVENEYHRKNVTGWLSM